MNPECVLEPGREKQFQLTRNQRCFFSPPFSLLFFFSLLIFFEIGLPCVVLAVLELTL